LLEKTKGQELEWRKQKILFFRHFNVKKQLKKEKQEGRER